MSPSTPRSTTAAAPAAGAIPEGEQGLRLFACERCSRRKQRCDRVLPVCAPCRCTPGAICERSRREDGVVRGRDMEVMRKGVVTTLLERIATLEREAAERGTAVAQSESEESPSQPEPEPAPDGGVNISHLSLSAMAEPRSRQGEFLKQLSVARLVASVTETYGGSPEATAPADPLCDGISRYIRNPVGASHRLHIPRREADKALATYLDLVDFRYPRLRVDKVRAGIDAVSAEDDGKHYREVLERDPAHVFMAYAVVAIVPLMSDGDSYPIAQGSWISIHLLGKCLEVLGRVFRQEDDVDVIQCLQLLVILSIHCSAAGSAWHLVGFAMNKCIALGYHREDPKSAVLAGATAEDLQQRRWAFWGCYWLDRLVCAALGRPFSSTTRTLRRRSRM
ncbi:Protein STB5-like protein 4 [Colletotrichum musicola]|uniref:Protein STB5-like protein 4 n=1 Tax=Colletotrichum musicola TaxID=2175873 RepID=A0A8H6JSW9_9PEZI|nr:Protein STB5-like protein 4 [Colletotrichum musicola]